MLLKRFAFEVINSYSSLDIKEKLISYSYHENHSLKSLELKSAYKKFFIINKLLGVNLVDRKDLPIRRQEA